MAKTFFVPDTVVQDLRFRYRLRRLQIHSLNGTAELKHSCRRAITIARDATAPSATRESTANRRRAATCSNGQKSAPVAPSAYTLARNSADLTNIVPCL